MSEQTLQQQEAPEQLSDILLVLDKDKKKIQAVKGVDENGELQTVDATKENQSQFMRVDKHGDIFSNFLSNFWRQLKNPTRFSFFKVPAADAVPAAEEIQRMVDNPTEKGQQILQAHEVKPDPDKTNKKEAEAAQPAQQADGHRYKAEEVDWETLGHFGISRETLEKRNLLDPLLKGYKTNELLPVSVNLGSVIVRTEARLSLQRNDEGAVRAAIHGVRKEPNLNSKFFGHEFSQEDKDNLLKTGNMGRAVNLTHHKTGEAIPSIISIDRLTNEVIALPVSKMKIPNEIKGVKLSDEQKQTLREGKQLQLDGMMSKKEKLFSAAVQYNADKNYTEFLFDRGNNNRQAQTNAQGQPQEAPRTFRGVKINEYDKYKEGQYVFIDGLVDKKGNSYQGYVRFNKETSKQDFTFPNKLKEQVQPAEAHKTQVAVNSEGKTNEATKHIQGPLKSAQQQPDNKQQQMQQEPEAPVLSKGIKR